MMDDIYGKKKIIVICALIVLALLLFYVLVKTNPDFVSRIPVVNGIAQKINSTPNSSSTNDKPPSPTSVKSFTVGAGRGSDSITPLSSSQLSPKGAYNDGEFTGFSTTSEGVLILKITITKGVLSDITLLTIPKDAPKDVLSSLAQEAIQSQVVEISPASGYDEVSQAFNLALSNAVGKAFKV